MFLEIAAIILAQTAIVLGSTYFTAWLGVKKGHVPRTHHGRTRRAV